MFTEEQRRTLQEQLDAKRERVSLMEARRAELVKLLALRRKSVQHQDDLMQVLLVCLWPGGMYAPWRAVHGP